MIYWGRDIPPDTRARQVQIIAHGTSNDRVTGYAARKRGRRSPLLRELERDSPF